MPETPTTIPGVAMATTAGRQLRQFTVEDYERMIAAGVFAERRRVELLAGEIVEMAAMGLAHSECMMRLTRILGHHATGELGMGVQIPILLDDMSQPEPDLFLCRWKPVVRPTPDDILLLIEVSDSTLDYDRNRKFPRYAAAGIPEAWLFDVAARILERHTEPLAGQYRRLETARAGGSLPSTTLPDLILAVDDILAPEKLA